MTTNSKNSRMRYRGHNNRRLYQKELSIKKEQRELGRALVNGLSCIGRTFGFLIINAILCFVHKNREAEMKQQAIELKIVNETQRVQKQIAYNKRREKLGCFDPKTNFTKDINNRVIGNGNMLINLILSAV